MRPAEGQRACRLRSFLSYRPPLQVLASPTVGPRSEPPSYSPNPGFAQYMDFCMNLRTKNFVTRDDTQPLSLAPLARKEDHSSVQQTHRRQSFVCTYIF